MSKRNKHKRYFDLSLTPYHRYFELVQVITLQSLKVRYRGSFLGTYWSLFNPLIMTGIYTALFGSEFAIYYGDSLLSYALAAFIGLIIIHFFSASTTQALTSVVVYGDLLNKISLPFSIFPVGIVTANIFQFMTGIYPVILGITLWRSHSIIHAIVAFLPLISLVMVCLGISFLVSGLYIFFRDLQYFYELVTFLLWISSPVFYSPEIVPRKIQPLLKLNPLFTIIESLRQVVLSVNVPDWTLLLSSLITGLAILGVGFACFQGWKSQYMDLL